MFKKILVLIPFALYIGAVQAQAVTHVLTGISNIQNEKVNQVLLAQNYIPLTDRYAVASVNDVFRDNILLNLAYLSGNIQSAGQINWDQLQKPMHSEFVLRQGEVFAFHDGVMAEYVGKTVKTTNAHFNANEGFRSSGYLFGDGVCHLASLLNWTASDAGLNVVAPVNHNFAKIPDIESRYGTAIYFSPGEQGINEQQNLYIENNFSFPVRFVIDSDKRQVTVRIYK